MSTNPTVIRRSAKDTIDGHEHFTGLTRAKLYELAGKGAIRSVSLREPGRIRGCRLFHLASILEYIHRTEAASAQRGEPPGALP